MKQSFNKPIRKPTLKRQFIKAFSIPTLIATIISIIITVTLINLYQQGFYEQSIIRTIIQNNRKRQSMPLLLAAIKNMEVTIQFYVNNLMKVRDYYSKSYKLYPNVNKKDMENYIEEHSKYALNIDNNHEDNSNLFQEKYDMSHGRWFIDYKPLIPGYFTGDNIGDMKKIQLKQLYHLCRTQVLMRSLIEVGYPGSNIIYFGDSKSELYYDYPINQNNKNSDDLTKFDHNIKCRTNDDKFPNYYYFKCRPFYLEIINNINKKASVALTDNYAFVNKEISISICINFKDPSSTSTAILCQDLNINDLMIMFEEYNNMLHGYFFITKIDSVIPQYFPNNKNSKHVKDFIQMEFDLSSQFNSEEITEYQVDLDSLIEKIETIETIEKDNSKDAKRKKNGKDYEYNVIPIKIFIRDFKESEWKEQHIMSLIHVNPSINDLDFQIAKITTSLVISMIFILMGLILFLVSQYLISSVAKGVVKPIANIRGLLEKMDDTEFGESTAYQLDSIENIKKKDLNDDDNSDDDEEVITKRSKNLQLLFVKLVDLKNSFRIIQEASTNTFKMPHLAHAQDTFIKIKNETASRVCHANLSNLFINLQKYDKALTHFSDALKSLVEDLHILYNPIIKAKEEEAKDKAKRERKQSNEFANGEFIIEKQDEFNNSLEELYKDVYDKIKHLIKSEYICMRYVKLFYCFRKYLKEMEKYTNDKGLSNPVIGHTEEDYENHLKDFETIVSYDPDNTRYDLVYHLEKVEYDIKFRFRKYTKEKEIINVTTETAIKEEARKLANEIINTFEQIDNLKNNMNKRDFSEDKNIQMTEIEIFNALDIPKAILFQRADYLQGNFHYKCKQYAKAFEFYQKVYDSKCLSNKILMLKSLKKIKKITIIFYDLVMSDLHDNRNINTLYLIDQKRQLVINKYLTSINYELIQYQPKRKDICIVLDYLIFTKKSDNILILRDVVRIFINNVNYNDNFCIFLSEENGQRIIMTLTKKTTENIEKIQEMILGYGVKLDSLRKENKAVAIPHKPVGSRVEQRRQVRRIDRPFERIKQGEAKQRLYSILMDSQQFLNKKRMASDERSDTWIIYFTAPEMYLFSFHTDYPFNKVFTNPQNYHVLLVLYNNCTHKSDNFEALKENGYDSIPQNELYQLDNLMGSCDKESQNLFQLEKFIEKK